jgi:hypothetical protein
LTDQDHQLRDSRSFDGVFTRDVVPAGLAVGNKLAPPDVDTGGRTKGHTRPASY